MNSQPEENMLSPAHKLFNCPIRPNILPVKRQSRPKSSTTKAVIDPETQNRLSTLEPEHTIRIRTSEQKTWNKKGSVISRNDHLTRTTS